MRSDLLSKRIFFAGCFGLPWLWIVHFLHANELEDNAANGGSQERETLDVDAEFPENETTLNQEQIDLSRRYWIQRCKTGAVTIVCSWIGWIAVAQVMKGHLPGNWYVRAPDDNEWTGW